MENTWMHTFATNIYHMPVGTNKNATSAATKNAECTTNETRIYSTSFLINS